MAAGEEGGDSNKNVPVMNRRHLIRSTKTDVGSLGQKSISKKKKKIIFYVYTYERQERNIMYGNFFFFFGFLRREQ